MLVQYMHAFRGLGYNEEQDAIMPNCSFYYFLILKEAHDLSQQMRCSQPP
jgi:hypothetical protein